MENGAGLINKIIGIIKDVGAVPKKGENAFHHYSYRRQEDVVNALQPALCKHGIVIVPMNREIVYSTPGHVIIKTTYNITDGMASLEFVGIGEGTDISRDGKPGDKASYKAQTGCLKYALNDLLMLATEDDPENDRATHDNDRPAKTAPRAEEPVLGQDIDHGSDSEKQRLALQGMLQRLGWSQNKRNIYLTKAKSLGYSQVIDEVQLEIEKLDKRDFGK